jgi:hypothetical protein
MITKYSFLKSKTLVIDSYILGIAYRIYDGYKDDVEYTSFLYGRMERPHHIDKSIESLKPSDVIERFGFPEDIYWDDVKETDLPKMGRSISSLVSEEIKKEDAIMNRKTA